MLHTSTHSHTPVSRQQTFGGQVVTLCGYLKTFGTTHPARIYVSSLDCTGQDSENKASCYNGDGLCAMKIAMQSVIF